METFIIIIIVFILIGFIIYSLKVENKSNWQTQKRDIQFIDDSIDFISSNANKVKKRVNQKISNAYITGCSWMLINESKTSILYTFRNNNELLITTNGIVEKCTYELIVDNQSILITKQNLTEHFIIINAKNDFLFISKMSTNEILTFANFTKFKDSLLSTIKQEASQYL
ncbi:hypothetical protein [Lutibacter sp.]|uniref:hypothetical protein n=1 Tax=Lutibacter sp. TaxID=1925666 RepID=UPI003568C2CC